jgi:hypothetical protein
MRFAIFLAFALITGGQSLATSRVVITDCGLSNGRTHAVCSIYLLCGGGLRMFTPGMYRVVPKLLCRVPSGLRHQRVPVHH